MAPFPLDLFKTLGPWAYLYFLAVGFVFGYILEISGFTESPILAAQFYLKDFRVLKVMFGAIVTASILIFGAVQLGLLDYNAIWVNLTYLWPMILGGFIMGIGFILGGFCPGTSMVAAASGRIDGVFFALGVVFGVGLFGFLEPRFQNFWFDSYYGRLTLFNLFHTTPGVIVFLVVLMALAAFALGEVAERHVGKKTEREPAWRYAAGGLALLAGLVLAFTSPRTPMEKWERMAPQMQPLLTERKVYVHPGEVLDTLANDKLRTVLIDVRSERDYNLFHLKGAWHVPVEEIPTVIPKLLDMTNAPNVVIIVMSNDEALATQAWKMLVASNVPNVYILEGGINHWLDYFAEEDGEAIQPLQVPADALEVLRWDFEYALGDGYKAAFPEAHKYKGKIPYTPKIELKVKRGPTSGGCG